MPQRSSPQHPETQIAELRRAGCSGLPKTKLVDLHRTPGDPAGTLVARWRTVWRREKYASGPDRIVRF